MFARCLLNECLQDVRKKHTHRRDTEEDRSTRVSPPSFTRQNHTKRQTFLKRFMGNILKPLYWKYHLY